MIVKFDFHVLENTCTLNYFSVSILDARMLSGWRWIKSGLTVFDSAGYQIIKLDTDWNRLAQKYNPFLFGQAWSSGLELYLVQWFVWLDYNVLGNGAKEFEGYCSRWANTEVEEWRDSRSLFLWILWANNEEIKEKTGRRGTEDERLVIERDGGMVRVRSEKCWKWKERIVFVKT